MLWDLRLASMSVIVSASMYAYLHVCCVCIKHLSWEYGIGIIDVKEEEDGQRIS